MDGNLVRVLSRVTLERGCVGETAVRRRLKAAGTELMSSARPGDFNQAMMGLGNMVCVPGKPRCGECPVREFCRAEKEGVQAELPNLPPKPEKKNLPVGVALVFSGARVLLAKRPDEGLLAGMWAFPSFEGARSEKDVREALEEMGLGVRRGERLTDAEHVFTHRVWKMKGWAYRLDAMAETENMRLVDRDGLDEAALPTAFRAYRQAASEILTQMTEEETGK